MVAWRFILGCYFNTKVPIVQYASVANWQFRIIFFVTKWQKLNYFFSCNRLSNFTIFSSQIVRFCIFILRQIDQIHAFSHVWLKNFLRPTEEYRDFFHTTDRQISQCFRMTNMMNFVIFLLSPNDEIYFFFPVSKGKSRRFFFSCGQLANFAVSSHNTLT